MTNVLLFLDKLQAREVCSVRPRNAFYLQSHKVLVVQD